MRRRGCVSGVSNKALLEGEWVCLHMGGRVESVGVASTRETEEEDNLKMEEAEEEEEEDEEEEV